MNLTILAAILVGANACLTAAIFWLRYQSNKALFKIKGQLQPINTSNPLFRGFNGFFNWLDRLPILRRSGTANEFDLLKAMLLVSFPYLILNLAVQRPGLAISLLAIGFYQTLVNAVLLAHPLLKRGKK